LKGIQVIVYILTNINYIELCRAFVAVGVWCWAILAVGGCWRWAVVEDGGRWRAVFAIHGVGCTVWVLVLGRPCRW